MTQQKSGEISCQSIYHAFCLSCHQFFNGKWWGGVEKKYQNCKGKKPKKNKRAKIKVSLIYRDKKYI